MTQSEKKWFEHTVDSVVRFDVEPNGFDAWRRRWETIAQEAEATDGCHYFRLAHDTQGDNKYVAITEWYPANGWLTFIERVPELQEMRSRLLNTPIEFYVLMEPGQEG